MSAIPDSSLPGHKHLHERVVAALDLCHESRDVEFKGPETWKILQYHIIRTAMAMTNLRDGGIIVIGVREADENWDPTGVDPATLATYDEDSVNDLVNSHASPQLRIHLVRVTYREMQFLAIRVPEFERSPTVCRRDGGDNSQLRCGGIYVRPTGKPQTTLVRNADELHDLLELAAEKRASELIQAAYRIGMRPSASSDDAYSEELGDL